MESPLQPLKSIGARSGPLVCAAALLWLCALVACFGGGYWPAYDVGAVQSLRIPGGPRCLQLLRELGVAHATATPRGGMPTPVEVRGPIAGVRYTGGGGTPLVCDCRLVLALHWAAPVFHAWGVSEIGHMGAYSNRTTRSGRPSLHARGLALDAAHFSFPDTTLSVEADYAMGLADGCSEDAPRLNRLACGLRSLGLFRELITPDHDADHHDHLHLAIMPL